MPLTLEEQERRAYISGDTAQACALGQAIDGIDARTTELAEECEGLKKDIERMERQEADLHEELEAADTRNVRLGNDLDELRDAHKALATELAEAHRIAMEALA